MQEYSLIDEKWIPVIPGDLASLKEIFSSRELVSLGGNPRQKVALLKFLLSVAQAARTPEDNAEWAAMGTSGLSEACLEYLDRWRDRFFLFGERPFLQMPVKGAKAIPIAALEPEKAYGNNPRLSHIQCSRRLSSPEKALILLSQMGMCLGGKRPDRSFSLADGYVKRTAACGPGIGYLGLLHSFLLGRSILETVWLNLLTMETIGQIPGLAAGLGVPP